MKIWGRRIQVDQDIALIETPFCIQTAKRTSKPVVPYVYLPVLADIHERILKEIV